MLSPRQVIVPYTAPQTSVVITCCDKATRFLGSIFVTGLGINDVFFHPVENRGGNVCQHTI